MSTLGQPGQIQGESTDDITWRRWLAGLRCHELSVPDWLPSHARLVVIAPHPDDEVIACGGLIATHIAQGGQILIVAVTDGEASHNSTSSINLDEFVALRRNERLQGLRLLGLENPAILFLALEDGRVQQHEHELFKRLISLLQTTDVVVSTWENDGHRDHNTAGRVARTACKFIGCAFLAAPVWMWHWASPGDTRVPWLRLRGLPLSAEDGVRKQNALAAHLSQLGPRGANRGSVLDTAIVERAAWRTEYYFV